MTSFNDMLTNDIVSFEQLGPDILFPYKVCFVGTHWICPMEAIPISNYNTCLCEKEQQVIFLSRALNCHKINPAYLFQTEFSLQIFKYPSDKNCLE